jgi:acetyl-CoA carboxylase biotin carboxylase subunit
MEVRLYAEDPDNNFFPSPGKILTRHAPSGPGIRLDDGVYEGWTVPNDYDPLLAKLIAWGNSREETIARLRRASKNPPSPASRPTSPCSAVCSPNPDFLKPKSIPNGWTNCSLVREKDAAEAGNGSLEATAIAAAVWQASRSVSSNAIAKPAGWDTASRWKQSARRDQLDRIP